MDIVRRCVAEFIGTFALVFVGVAAISVGREQGGGLLSVALAFGLTVAVMVSATLHISGGQFNPAVSIALMLTRKMSVHDTIFYVLAQLLGALAGAAALQLMFGGYINSSGTPVPAGPFFTPMKAMWMEVVLTFILVFVIFGVAVDKRGPNVVAGLLIGLTVTLDILIGGPYTGASMNPARSFGPALVGSKWDHHWVYWAGPILGGALAGLIYNFAFLSPLRARPAVAVTTTTTTTAAATPTAAHASTAGV
jgi:MIP family channel proteins